MIYLASPYSHPDPFVREQRYLMAAKALSELLAAECWAYSPIVHCHELAKIVDLPTHSAFWRRYDFHMLSLSTELLVLMLEGWKTSEGVREEIAEAARLNITVTALQPEWLRPPL